MIPIVRQHRLQRILVLGVGKAGAAMARAAESILGGRVSEGFVVTIPHPGVWVSAQAHEPVQQQETDSHEAAG